MTISLRSQPQVEDFIPVMNLHSTVFKHGDEGKYTAEGAYTRLKDSKDTTVFELFDNDVLVGFAIGYERYPDYYHIWQLGIDEGSRGRGGASSLYHAVEKFAREHGYKGVTLNTFNQFKDNLRLALKLGYEIYDLDKSNPENPKINMRKQF